MRAINDPEFRRIFCIIHVEKLSYQISDLALSSLSKHSQEKQGTMKYICTFEQISMNSGVN